MKARQICSVTSPNAPKIRIAINWLGNLALVVVISVGCVLSAEWAVRLFIPQPLPQPMPEIYRPDPVIGWRRNENVRIVANTGERDVEICTDRWADRVDCTPREHDCVKRILVLGDSFVEALAVPWSKTVWSRLERDTGACLLVAGVGGYGPPQYAVQARERLGHNVHFDLVILTFYSGNDFVDDGEAIPPSEMVEEPKLRLVPAGLRAIDLWNWCYALNQWLEARSHLFVATRYVVRRHMDPEGVALYGVPIAVLRSRLTEKHLQETAHAISRVAAAAETAGTPTLVTIIPVQNQVLDPRGERLAAAFNQLAGEIDMDQVSQRFLPLVADLSGVSRVVDLLPYLRKTAGPDAWGRRDPHFSPAGHALWYEGIRSAVRDLLTSGVG